MPDTESPVALQTDDECWALLEGDELGRLAYRLVDEVHVVPINYVVDDRSLLFRTGSGNKLLAAALESDVAFEIDGYDDDTAWSVVARGHLRRLAEDEAHRIDLLPTHSWTTTLKYEVIELVPEVLTGRRFVLNRAGDGKSDHDRPTG